MATQEFTFTLAKLKALKPREKTYAVRDTKNPVLSARVTPGGIVTLQVRRRPKGSHKVVTVSICKLSDGIPMANVYERVVEIAQSLNAGVNPNEQKRQNAIDKEVASRTLREVYSEYQTKLNPHTHKPLSSGTLNIYDRTMNRDLDEWADQPMINITGVMVLDRFKQLNAKYGSGTAQKMAGLIGACWAYANDMADIGNGAEAYGPPPLRLLNKMLPGWRKTASRTRKINDNDLPAWLAAVRGEGGIAGAFLEMLLLTGMRRRELSELRWTTVDMRRRVFTVPHTKNGTPLTLPITDRVMELLRWSRKAYPKADRPLPALDPRGAISRVTKQTGVPFSCHDLRRSFTTLADKSGAGQYIIKAVLNHASGGDVTSEHYVQYDADDLREPMQKIENFILSKAKAHRDNVLEVVR